MNPEDLKLDRTRRQLIRLGLAGAVGSAVLAAVGTLRFFYLRTFYEHSTTFKIGKPESFALDSTRFLEDEKIFVCRDAEGIYVISALCPHLGCVVTRTGDDYLCPCHGSTFGPTGKTATGPAPGGLRWLHVSLSPDGYLVVDRERTVDTGEKFRHV